jgi:hypothetical protein
MTANENKIDFRAVTFSPEFFLLFNLKLIVSGIIEATKMRVYVF